MAQMLSPDLGHMAHGTAKPEKHSVSLMEHNQPDSVDDNHSQRTLGRCNSGLTAVKTISRVGSPSFIRKKDGVFVSPMVDLRHSPTTRNLHSRPITIRQHVVDFQYADINLQSKYEQLRHQYHLLQNQFTRANSKMRLAIIKEAEMYTQNQRHQRQMKRLMDYVDLIEKDMNALRGELIEKTERQRNSSRVDNPEISSQDIMLLRQKLAQLQRDNLRKNCQIQQLQKQSLQKYIEEEQKWFRNSSQDNKNKLQQIALEVEYIRQESKLKQQQCQRLQQQLDYCRLRLQCSLKDLSKTETARRQQQIINRTLKQDCEKFKQELYELQMTTEMKFRKLFDQLEEKDIEVKQLHRYVGELEQLADRATIYEKKREEVQQEAVQTQFPKNQIATQTQYKPNTLQKVQSQRILGRGTLVKTPHPTTKTRFMKQIGVILQIIILLFFLYLFISLLSNFIF